MSGVFSVGQNAISLAQLSVTTVGQNIANVSTPGYSRQNVVQTSSPGHGAEVIEVKRAYSEFLGAQVLSSQSASSELSAQYTQITQVDNLLADSAAGLAPSLQDFFNGLQGLSAYPADSAPRQTVLASAEALVTRFKSIDARLSEIAQGVNQELGSRIENINLAAERLASLNASIYGMGDNTPNELLDQRDQVLRDLSKEINVTISKNQKGQLNVLIGSGQPLVMDEKTYPLKVKEATAVGGPASVVGNFGTGDVTLSANQLKGGGVGGLLTFRDQTLDGIQTKLDQIATAFATGINSQHAQGYRPDGTSGTEFFNIADADHPAGSISLKLTDISQIAAASGVAASGKVLAGDNGNVKNLLNFQNQKVLNDGNSSVSSAYAQLVGEVGSKTKELELTSASAEKIHAQTSAALDQVAGVNLDEEAANLIRYQQAYQAAGKLLQIAKQMFDDVLNINN